MRQWQSAADEGAGEGIAASGAKEHLPTILVDPLYRGLLPDRSPEADLMNIRPRRLAAHALPFCLLSAVAVYSQTAKEPPAPEFELRVGDTVYQVSPDQPFTITTASGEKLQAVLKRKEILRFTAPEISFNYPREMKVSAERSAGLLSVSVEATESPLAIVQVYSVPTTPAEIRKSLVDELTTRFKNEKAKFLPGNGRAVKRKIAGAERDGQALELMLASLKMRSEVYTFTKGKAVVAVVLQAAADDEALAKKYFQVISDSME